MTNEVRVISYIIGSDSDYYNLHHFTTFSVPTADTLFLLILSILTLEYAHSIRFLYRHFLSGITEKSLNVFYYACSYAKVNYSRFMNTTARIALKLIPDSLQTQPVFLCVDDGIAFYKKKCKVFVENWRLKYNKFCYRDELFFDL